MERVSSRESPHAGLKHMHAFFGFCHTTPASIELACVWYVVSFFATAWQMLAHSHVFRAIEFFAVSVRISMREFK
jgi:hypothetical protein